MFEHSLIVGKFAPFHRGHQHLVEAALSESRLVTVLVYSRPDFVAMPQALRAAWIALIYPDVRVVVPADPPPDDAGDVAQRIFVRRWLLAENIEPDCVFSSEFYGEGFAAHLGVTHRLVDQARSVVPVSGSAIRHNLKAHAKFLHPRVLADLARAGDLNARFDPN